MKTVLWLDDFRNPKYYNNWDTWINEYSPIREPYKIVWVKSYSEFINYIINNKLPDAICFDHDLADIHYKYKDLDDYEKLILENDQKVEKTGYDCAKWLVNYCIDNNKQLPLYNIQSTNPVGKENIRKLLENFKNKYNV